MHKLLQLYENILIRDMCIHTCKYKINLCIVYRGLLSSNCEREILREKL